MNRVLVGFWVFLLSALAGAALVALAGGMIGCAATVRHDPPKTAVSVTTTDFDGMTGKPMRTTVEKVESAGPGGQASGDNAHIDTKGTPPTVETRSIKTGGGSIDSDGDASIAKSNTARWIVGIVGFALLCAGGAALKIGQPLKAAVGTIVIGLGLIICALFPALALYILCGLALYAAASLWLTGWDATRFREALRSVAQGVSEYAAENTAHGPLLLRKIKAAQDPGDNATIDKIKRKDNLK